MEAVFILLIISVALMFIALYKKDSSLIMFSGIFYVFIGLIIINAGFGDLIKNYSFWLGFIIVFLGLYLFIRTGLELLIKKKEVD